MNRLLTIFALILFIVPAQALAQDSISFSVSPTIFDMTGTPGQTWRSTIRVINSNPYELTIYSRVVNFRPQGESGVPRFVEPTGYEDNASNLAAWIATEPQITIPAERTVELPININVPEDADIGGHYAAILIGTKPLDEEGDIAKIATSQIISTLIFLRVPGDLSEIALVRSFRTSDYILNRPEATFELRIENKGNVYLQPSGEISIYNMWGQERGVIPVNQYSLYGNVLSHSVRKYTFDWKGEWSFTDIGRYTAKASLTYGQDSKQSVFAETSFWVFPWKIVLGILLVLVGFIKLFAWAIKAYIRRMLAVAGVPTRESSTTGTTPRKRLSMSGPIEAGMLDLRQRFQETDSPSEYLTKIAVSVKAYWKFIVVVIAAILFVYAAVWFVSSALTPNRDYEVTTDSGTVITSEQIEDGKEGVGQDDVDTSADPTVLELGKPVIKLVNRTGQEELADFVVALIRSEGIEIDEISEDLSSTEVRTVIVFSPSETEQALAFSDLLNNAPLSALPDEGLTTTPEITIYLGTDSETLIVE